MTLAPSSALIPRPTPAGAIPSPRTTSPGVPSPTPGGDLQPATSRTAAFLTAAPAAAEELARTRPRYTDVVAWLSGHLAALDGLVYPAAIRSLPQARRSINAQRARSRDLERQLRRLHAHLNGDGSAPRRELTRLHDQLQQTLASHSEGERGLLAQLQQALDVQDWEHLSSRYRASLRHGPTRPHPSIPRSRLAYRAAAVTDRLLDVLESRPVHPVPRSLAA